MDECYHDSNRGSSASTYLSPEFALTRGNQQPLYPMLIVLLVAQHKTPLSDRLSEIDPATRFEHTRSGEPESIQLTAENPYNQVAVGPETEMNV